MKFIWYTVQIEQHGYFLSLICCSVFIFVDNWRYFPSPCDISDELLYIFAIIATALGGPLIINLQEYSLLPLSVLLFSHLVWLFSGFSRAAYIGHISSTMNGEPVSHVDDQTYGSNPVLFHSSLKGELVV